MKVDLHAEQGIVEIFSNAVRIYREHSQVLLPLAVLVVPVGIGSGYLAERTTPIIRTLIPFTLVSVLQALSAGGMIHVVDRSRRGELTSLGSALRAIGRQSGRLITTQLLAVFMKTLTIVIFPYFLVRWWFTTQAVMLDDVRGWDALGASSNVVSGRWWRAASILFVILLGQGTLVLTTLLIIRSAAPPDPLLWRLAIALISAAWAPLVVCAETVLYLDLKARVATQELWSSTS